MQLRKSLITISGENGFTLIEVVLVVAIIAVLATIGIGEFANHRREAFDRQTLVKAREWLTVATVAVANQELAAIIGATSQGTPPDFSTIDMNPTIHWSYANAGGDVWQFYLASASGNTAFYFWIPGPGCAVNVDSADLPSDQIFEDPDWRAAPIGL